MIDTWESQDHWAPSSKAYSSSLLYFFSNQPGVQKSLGVSHRNKIWAFDSNKSQKKKANLHKHHLLGSPQFYSWYWTTFWPFFWTMRASANKKENKTQLTPSKNITIAQLNKRKQIPLIYRQTKWKEKKNLAFLGVPISHFSARLHIALLALSATPQFMGFI